MVEQKPENIHVKLGLIQRKLDAPKNQRNMFVNYNYRSCEDILAALKPLLEETKTYLLLSDEIVMIGSRYYIRATATLSNAEQSISVSAYAREAENKKGMDESQITGASSSYARKYALNGLFCIDDTRDADATYTHEKEVKSVFPGKQRSNDPNPKPMSEPKSSCAVCGIDITENVAKYSREHFMGISLCMLCQKKQREIEEKQEEENGG